MRQLTEITDEANQEHIVKVITGELFTLQLFYLHRNESWQANIIYNDNTINGIKINQSVNILRQYKNILPFGIACYSDYNTDPFLLEDFAQNNYFLGILTADEVIEAERQIAL